jgi:hypothetical protein
MSLVSEVLTEGEERTVTSAEESGIDNGLMDLISERLSREILLATMERGKSVEDICMERGIPLSTCYRRVADLVKKNLLIVDKIVVTNSGKRYAIYKSTVKEISVNLSLGHLTLRLSIDHDMADRLRTKWLSMRYK